MTDDNKKTVTNPKKAPTGVPQASLEYRKMKPKELETFRKFKGKDNLDKKNLSRGVIGFVNNPKGGHITEGTIADKVNPPSRSNLGRTANLKGKELTKEEVDKKIKAERESAINKKRIAEEAAKKLRIRQQRFPYTPPEDLKNIPFLAAESDEPEEGLDPKDQINEEDGEELIGEEQIESQERKSASLEPEGEEEFNEEEDDDIEEDENEEEKLEEEEGEENTEEQEQIRA